MALRNLKVSTRISCTVALLLLLMLVLTAVGLRQIGRIGDALNYYDANTTPSLATVRQWAEGLDALRILQARRVIEMATAEGSSGEPSRLDADIARGVQAVQQSVAAYEALLSNDEDKRLWQAVTAANAAYFKGLTQAADAAAAQATFGGESAAAYDAAMAAVDKEWVFNVELARSLAREGDAIQQSAWLIIGVALVAASLIGSGVAVWLARSITRPLNQAVTVANRVAEGDLGSPISVSSTDECGRLLDALRRMQQQLALTVAGVREGADSVATASEQIAQGNLDLSTRTELQASTLQQTAASMDQLGSTVRQNADHALQADQLAQSASAVAAQGGAAVGQVVETMKAIDQSSKRIADIIGVIDGIAFQTNILALNAAVEAARAGEQGRGFAVVATEVRGLAQRSAEAAKEIKTLISASVERVGLGTVQADRAGVTMTEVVQAIQRVTAMVAEINAAGTVQSSGVAQVSQAVGQMDQATQQNAALVEQSAAAAESLKLQARQLVQSVATFKLLAAG